MLQGIYLQCLVMLKIKNSMKTKSEKRAKAQRIKEKLSIRKVWKTTPKEKKWPTGELELFKRIAYDRQNIDGQVNAKHIYKDWQLWYKMICLGDLTVTNFSHIVSKWRDKTKRLDPKNIEIVSRAYHEWQHSLQIPQTNYIN